MRVWVIERYNEALQEPDEEDRWELLKSFPYGDEKGVEAHGSEEDAEQAMKDIQDEHGEKLRVREYSRKSKVEVLSKPTIAELEALMEQKGLKIEVLPNGEVRARRLT